MRFIDEVRVRVKGGHGGAGMVGWRREKYVPMGGPNGGDGGNGGAVVFLADPGLSTLLDFHFKHELYAEDGQAGQGSDAAGRDGDELVCKVPVGTQVIYRGRVVADLAVPHARWIAAKGGRGGKGNAHFTTSTRRAPDFAQPGTEGQEFEFTLSLKSVADVGLVGLPNVGKSTLVATVSNAKPKIADYPFTTLAPHIGYVAVAQGASFVIADIPGIIPGAHEGKGLGIAFLKHIERTRVLCQLIDLTNPWVEDDEMASDEQSAILSNELSDEQVQAHALRQFTLIDSELRQFSPELAERPRLIAFSKCDLPVNKRAVQLTRKVLESRGFEVFELSTAHNEGVSELMAALFRELPASTRE